MRQPICCQAWDFILVAINFTSNFAIKYLNYLLFIIIFFFCMLITICMSVPIKYFIKKDYFLDTNLHCNGMRIYLSTVVIVCTVMERESICAVTT